MHVDFNACKTPRRLPLQQARNRTGQGQVEVITSVWFHKSGEENRQCRFRFKSDCLTLTPFPHTASFTTTTTTHSLRYLQHNTITTNPFSFRLQHYPPTPHHHQYHIFTSLPPLPPPPHYLTFHITSTTLTVPPSPTTIVVFIRHHSTGLNLITTNT
ncbi:hypothetical protein Pmani_030966 [Petrolisthes manimaculis]|uniref:Uncharacterized protein n=1 Tax=Petrolisthes manimaculis TaxID=1843537 RepID=A0AAE1TT29_9EUCA|nr:hypothetical protein Pmani_030966 [Petrolisthes manimaculis]